MTQDSKARWWTSGLWRSLVTAVSAVAMLAGCSDPHAADKGNFAKAIDEHLAKNPVCLSLQLQPSGVTSDMGNMYAQYQALVKAGLMHVTAIKDNDFVGKMYSFAPTAAGQRFVVTDHLCYGQEHVAVVGNFTIPTDVMGYKVSQVAYTYTVSDVPSWANDKKMQSGFPEIAQELGGQHSTERSAALALTNDGWSEDPPGMH